MPKDFNYWKKLYDGEDLKDFNHSDNGLLWLKTKSIIRRGIIDEFIEQNNLKLAAKILGDQFVELFELLSDDIPKSHTILNSYMINKNSQKMESLDIDNLVKELYKVDSFRWGADNQNDLGKYLVKKYIKDNNSYDYLLSHIDNGIMKTVQDYLICSWYNHWSSILIEHIFKTHKIVLPTVGQIKSVDFFINEIPFDLKVTYLPTFFIEEERKKVGLPAKELQSLKNSARELNIHFDNNDSNLYYLLTERLKDNGSSKAEQALNEIKEFKLDLIQQIKKNPKNLAKGLYEKQSSFRFGAENRMFLVLVDTENFDESWKLKRNIDLLKPSIHKYLDDFENKKIDDMKLHFYREGNRQQYPKEFEVITDIIVIGK